MIKHVTYFLKQGHEELAYRILGAYVLANVRGALTVGLAVEKQLAPEPSSSKPTSTASKSTTEEPEGFTTDVEMVSTTEAPEGSATDAEVESTTEASVEEKRMQRHQNRRMHEI